MNQLTDPFNITRVEEQLFKPVMTFKRDLKLNEVIYAYYIYLTKEKGFSSTDALKYISTQYKACEAGSCQLDDGFTKNDAELNKIMEEIQATITQYAKDIGLSEETLEVLFK